jgi:hypothetical protein
MNIDIIKTPSTDRTTITVEGLSFSDTEKADKLINSSKSKLTRLWLRKILKNLGEIDTSETRWDLSEDKKEVIIFHAIKLADESRERVQFIRENINHLIKCFPYYLYLLKDYSFSKSIDPLITDTSIVSSLNSDIKEFIKIQIESGIASKGYYLLTGFDFFTPNESDSLRITPKEINNSTHDSNTIFTTRGVVIDFNYEELQFTLAIDEEENMPEASVEHSKTKMKFYFADDELLSANQEAYFHRYKYSPQPVITVHYVALPLGNFVCLDKMEEIDVRSPQASG